MPVHNHMLQPAQAPVSGVPEDHQLLVPGNLFATQPTALLLGDPEAQEQLLNLLSCIYFPGFFTLPHPTAGSQGEGHG